MRGIDEHKAILDSAVANAFLDIRGDVDEGPSGRHVEPEFLAVAFHSRLLFLFIKTSVLRMRILEGCGQSIISVVVRRSQVRVVIG